MKRYRDFRLLAVDDRPSNLFTLRSLIQQHMDVEVLEATSGQQAIDIALQRGDIDLILLDVQMPVLDGFEVAELMRQSGLDDFGPRLQRIDLRRRHAEPAHPYTELLLASIPEPELRTMVMLLSIILLLYTRSIFIPSSPVRTLVLSSATALPLAVYALATESPRLGIWKAMWLLAAISNRKLLRRGRERPDPVRRATGERDAAAVDQSGTTAPRGKRGADDETGIE